MRDILEFGGKRYRLVEEGYVEPPVDESPWPFEPKSGMHPSIMIESEDWHANAAVCGLERLFPNRAEADKAAAHLRRVLRSLRLYENAKATGTLDDCWAVSADRTTRPIQDDSFGAPMRRYDVYIAMHAAILYAQAGRLFATEAEARAFAEGQE